jgi:membrane protein required for beta-lactamase induction
MLEKYMEKLKQITVGRSNRLGSVCGLVYILTIHGYEVFSVFIGIAVVSISWGARAVQVHLKHLRPAKALMRRCPVLLLRLLQIKFLVSGHWYSTGILRGSPHKASRVSDRRLLHPKARTR